MTLLFLPLLFDTLAMAAFVLSGSREVYSLIVTSADVLFPLAYLATIVSSTRLLRERRWLLRAYLPAGLALIAAVFQVALGTGNALYILAFVRYITWFCALAVYFDRQRDDQWEQFEGRLKFITLVLFSLSAAQILLHPILVDRLAELHGSLTDGEKVNGVLTSIRMDKTFASLTLRNPVELSFIGMALLVISLSHGMGLGWSLLAFGIVAAGRSNSSVIISAVLAGRALSRHLTLGALQRRGVIAVIAVASAVFLFFLPEIYIGPGAKYEDLLTTLSYQRLGMVIAAPALIANMSGPEVLIGIVKPIEAALSDLFSVGILPALFEDGGFIAIFDVVWVGMLVVGGLAFVLAAVTFLSAMARAGRESSGFAGEACRLYMLALTLMSFVSQVFLSRYMMYFSCWFMAYALFGAKPKRAA